MAEPEESLLKRFEPLEAEVSQLKTALAALTQKLGDVEALTKRVARMWDVE